MLFNRKKQTHPIYSTTVSKVGASAKDFVSEKMVIFFGDQAPDYLAEYCYIIEPATEGCPVCVNDYLQIGHKQSKITAIGEVALQNMKALGHLVVKFDGASVPVQPGTMHVSAGEVPAIEVGTQISFEKAI